MEEACTFIVSNFLRCKGRNNIVKCKNILLLNKTVRKVLFGGAFIIGVCNEYLQWAFIMGVCSTYPAIAGFPT